MLPITWSVPDSDPNLGWKTFASTSAMLQLAAPRKDMMNFSWWIFLRMNACYHDILIHVALRWSPSFIYCTYIYTYIYTVYIYTHTVAVVHTLTYSYVHIVTPICISYQMAWPTESLNLDPPRWSWRAPPRRSRCVALGPGLGFRCNEEVDIIM